MKKSIQSFLRGGLFLAVLTFALSAFRSPAGGDLLEVYQGGKMVLKQYMHLDEKVRTVKLSSAEPVKVYYGHCGTNGHSRTLILRDNAGKSVKKWSYADQPGTAKSMMECRIQEVVSSLSPACKQYSLSYLSKEMESEKLLLKIEI